MSLFSLPDQTIPETQKTKDWHIDHAVRYAQFSLSPQYNNQKKEILKLYRGFNAELSEEEAEAMKRITCPNGIDQGVPFIVYPLIQTKIEQLVGEYLLRPLRRTAYAIDKKSKNRKFQEKVRMLGEELMREQVEKMKQDLGFDPTTENPDMQLPKDVEEFFQNDFKMLAEQVANRLLEFILDARKEKQKFKEMFLDYCVSDRAHTIIDKYRGHTSYRKVHPLDADYDIDPYSVVQKDHEFFFENYWLSENEIYNTFTLSKTDKAAVKEFFEMVGNLDLSNSDDLGLARKYDGWYDTANKTGRMRVVNAMWKSRRRTTYKESVNKKTGKKIYKKLKDESQARSKDVVKNIDGEIPRHVVMLGPEVCLSWGEMEQRFSTKDNPFQCTLPVVSIVRDNTTGTSLIKSPAAKLYQLQEFASEILYEIRMAMKHAGDSRVLVYDVSQIPKQFTKGGASGLNRVFHHIKKDKMMLINSKERGNGKGNSFNQFTSLDLSQKGAIKDLFEGLAIIEDLASKFVGIAPEREGQVGQYQTKGGTEAAIRGSSARSEVIFSPFDDFIQALLEKTLIKMRKDYPEGEVIQYVIGDMKTRFIKLYKDFFEADLGIFLSDSRKDREISERIDMATEMALSTSSTPEMIMGLIEVFEGESASEKKAVFSRLINSLEKVRQENQKAAQAAQEAELKQKAEEKQQEMQKAREDNETEIQVAKIYADSKASSDNIKANSQEKIEAARIYDKVVERAKNGPQAKQPEKKPAGTSGS